MPSYSDPLRQTYSFSVGIADATWAIPTPPGCTTFRVADINVSVTTTFTAAANSAKLGVGVAGNVDDAGFVALNTTAGGSAVGWSAQKAAGTNPKYQAMDVSGTSNTITGTPKVPLVLGPALVTFVADADVGAAGAGVADVTLDWF